MPTHTVKKGECLASIAQVYGFHNWRSIYDHPQNAALKQKRPNPNLLSPGDEIFIPERQSKPEPVATEKRHLFRVELVKTSLKMAIQKEDGTALANSSYQLQLGDQTIEGVTDSEGRLEHQINPKLEKGELTVQFEEGSSEQSFTWLLEIGHLEPVEEVRGVQARLNNLGFDSGPEDGISGDWTRSAIEAFQKAYGLKVDGIVGPQTSAKLKEVYGC